MIRNQLATDKEMTEIDKALKDILLSKGKIAPKKKEKQFTKKFNQDTKDPKKKINKKGIMKMLKNDSPEKQYNSI